jgi:predicted RNA methylase
LTNKKSDLISRYFRYQVDDVQHDIETIENNALLLEANNFDKRTEAIDFIDFHLIDRIEGLLPETDHSDELIVLKNRAEKIKAELEAIDIKLFQKLQDNIRNGSYTSEGFKNMIHEYVDFDLTDSDYQQEAGYDNLDVFINGLFFCKALPEQTLDLEPEMVFYQKTPVRIVLELLEKINFTKYDVFFDLGSGLGHVAMLVNLLTRIKTIGIEFEPAFCRYAEACADNLNLSNIEFINADARKADYSSGTVFFMYTPFNGKIMEDVLEVLRMASLSKTIKIITYGPCTAEIASQPWLKCEEPQCNNIYRLTVFNSLQG